MGISNEGMALATIQRHRDFLRIAMDRVTHQLSERSVRHDESKLRSDEFEGFVKINRAGRENEYGSEEYKASLRSAQSTIDLHYSRNSHHPEHHPDGINSMPLLDLIEMVCDWWAASKAYGKTRFVDGLEIQFDRYSPDDRTKHLIIDVAEILVSRPAREVA